MVYATVALNKASATLLKSFDQATAAFGYPLRLRADMCFEAVPVGQRMVDMRGPEGFLTGPFTANQVMLCDVNAVS